MTSAQIEQRSLTAAKWANLFMGVAGVAAALISNASALMLDGLFSGVNFLAAVFAAKVAARVQRRPDALRPFGYEIDEAVFVMFRSLVLTGILIVAALNAAAKIYAFAMGEHIPEIKLNWIIAYTALMVAICFSLAAWHQANYRKTSPRSGLLLTERTGAVIDGLMSLAAGLAFVGISLLKGTFLAFLVPISDAIVVMGLAAWMMPHPIRMFSQALGEVAGEPVDAKSVSEIREAIERALVDRPFTVLEVAVTKTGRSLFGAAYIRPEQASDATVLDSARAIALEAFSGARPEFSARMEVIFRGAAPYPSSRANRQSIVALPQSLEPTAQPEERHLADDKGDHQR